MSIEFTLRPFQKQALASLHTHSKLHLVCVAPTGSGKSLIYERYTKDSAQRLLLVTPLTALARQQHRRLLEHGIHATLGAGPDAEGPPTSARGQSAAWIICPEKVLNRENSTLAALKRWRPTFMTVDECHCVFEWGEGFRPAYSHLPDLAKRLEIPQSLWLTATLPHQDRQELRQRLPKPSRELGEFDLPPLMRLRVMRVGWRDRFEVLHRWIEIQPSPGIVFTNTRKLTERIAGLLKSAGIPAANYHAALSHEEKLWIERNSKKLKTIVATTAFGMGVDLAHFRWVVVFEAPFSLLDLAQRIGRVGRADREGIALILWHEDDLRLNQWACQGSEKKVQDQLKVFDYLNTPGCRRAGLKRYFERELLKTVRDRQCHACDYCEVGGSSGSLKNEAIL